MRTTIVKAFVARESHFYSINVHLGHRKINFRLQTLENIEMELENKVRENQKEESDLKVNLIIHYDFQSFFNYHDVLNQRAFSRRIGMNHTLLSQYIQGKKKPSPKQVDRILKGLNELGKVFGKAKF